MRFSLAAVVSVLSISTFSGVMALPTADFSLEARNPGPEDFANLMARVASLEARKKSPKVSFDLKKGALNSKDRQSAQDDAEDCLEHFGSKSGTVIYGYHLSNGESVEHITIVPDAGKKIHAYRDGTCTQGRPDSGI